MQVVDDVEPYELMKLRLLNASHQSLCYFGYLSGYRSRSRRRQDPLFAEFLLHTWIRRPRPRCSRSPGSTCDEYNDTLIERFSNPGDRDTIGRIVRDPPTASRSGCCR